MQHRPAPVIQHVVSVINPVVHTTVVSHTSLTDWLTAGGTLFAALGTVGAVVVALWQNALRDRRNVQMRVAGVLSADPPPRVMVRITNDRYRPVRFDFAPTLVAEQRDGSRIALDQRPIPAHSAQLPQTIEDGQTLAFVWDSQEIRDQTTRHGAIQPLFVSVIDALGNRFECPYLGVTKVRKHRWNPLSEKVYKQPTVFFAPPLRPGESLDDLNKKLTDGGASQDH